MAETDSAPASAASRTIVLAVAAVVLAAGLAALSWLDARHRIATTQEELARRLREIESDAREARSVARQGQEALRESQVRHLLSYAAGDRYPSAECRRWVLENPSMESKISPAAARPKISPAAANSPSPRQNFSAIFALSAAFGVDFLASPRLAFCQRRT